MCLSYNWTDPKWRKEYSETLVTYIINKGAWNFLFQAVYSQLFDTAWFLTKLTTSVSWLILENELSRKSTTKQQTPAQVHALEFEDKSRKCYQQWYK